MLLSHKTYIIMQWHSYTGAHWGTGPTISLCGPAIKVLPYHVIQLIISTTMAIVVLLTYSHMHTPLLVQTRALTKLSTV